MRGEPFNQITPDTTALSKHLQDRLSCEHRTHEVFREVPHTIPFCSEENPLEKISKEKNNLNFFCVECHVSWVPYHQAEIAQNWKR